MLVALLLAGCATGRLSMRTTIAGGEQIAVPLGPRGVEPSQEDGVRIEFAGCKLNAQKELVYGFELSDERNRALRRVRVEDVSDETPLLLVDDEKPELKKNRWEGMSRGFESGDRAVAWTATITNSLRVFRFKLTFADGREMTLLQGSLFPNPMKSAIRQVWGKNY